ncbi:hypothetical protein L218DRAFT_991829 [Neofusicoccum parvum]|uniref:Uncharacterized protein n=1 Tax=Neofusicoccum parvum TaxID=310453 RepID=A0ACB5SBL4_9PEZI|nr:hypothetical protein L218DRAFT_991829 [Neofusicoccum parvum]GME64468.1 hypothetical protein L218DRAFT_991829 [Neofusicoccum parvum]
MLYFSNRIAVACLAVLVGSVGAANGPAFSTGPVSSGNFIREATSTLVVPAAPGPVVGNTVLWVGMGTSNGDLIQGINNNYPPDNQASPCSNLGGNWCVAAYTLHKTSDTTQESISGPRSNSRPGDQVTMHYRFDDATGNYTQVVSVNGVSVSQISTNSGHAQGWGTALECTTRPCGSVPAHSWINTVITMNSPDPNYIQTNWKGPGVTGDLKTTDGGLTWRVDKISIPAYTFTTA